MRILIIAALAATSLTATANAKPANDKAELAALVAKAATATTPEANGALCTADAVIVDDFAPHVWQGASACANWAKDYGAFVAQKGEKDPKVMVGKVRHVQVDGDTAYAVYPATINYTDKDGKAVTQAGNTWTFAFKKVAKAWKISGWSWADGPR